MKRIKVIDLFGIDYKKMNDTIDEVMEELQRSGKKVIDFRVMGSALNKCAVFIMYEDESMPE